MLTLGQGRIKGSWRSINYVVPFGQSFLFYLVCTSDARWYDEENTMERWYDGEKTMVRWWKRDGMMMKSRWRDNTMVKTRCYIAFSPSYHRFFTIVPSRFHHRNIAFSPSYHHVFTIVTSRFHHRNIAFSPSYHRVFIIVSSYHPVFTILPRK
jgi:ribosomal protein S18 acetylase RimI-like enzyme